MDKDRLLQLKKKLFILAGYLMVTALLFVYVSYSQYKISIEATVRMPKVYTMSAGIDLSSVSGGAITDRGLKFGVDELADEHVAEGKTEKETAVEIKGFLDELVPGNKAETFAAKENNEPGSETQHKLVVKIDNKLETEDPETGEKITTASPLDIKYTLSVQTDGVLPLHFVLYDNGTTYSALTTHTADKAVQEVVFKNPDGSAKEFFISAGAIDAAKGFNENTHEIFVGWNNTSTGNTDIELCKEVEKIVVKAKITSLPAPKATYTQIPEPDLEHTYFESE